MQQISTCPQCSGRQSHGSPSPLPSNPRDSGDKVQLRAAYKALRLWSSMQAGRVQHAYKQLHSLTGSSNDGKGDEAQAGRTVNGPQVAEVFAAHFQSTLNGPTQDSQYSHLLCSAACLVSTAQPHQPTHQAALPCTAAAQDPGEKGVQAAC